MREQIIEFGDSGAIVLPKELLDQLELRAGAWVELELRDGSVTIRPVDVDAQLSAEDRKFVEEFYKKNEAVFKALAE